jgi:hypothetical protein
MTMTFDTKIAVVLRADLETWRKLNVTAFTVSAIAGTVDGIMGEPYEDASGNRYLPMLRQPVMIYAADEAKLRKAYERAMREGVPISIFTDDLFLTGNDIDNRAAVRAVPQEALHLAGIALRTEKRLVDKVLKGCSLHP